MTYYKLTEIFSDERAAEIKEHFSSLRYLLVAATNRRMINRIQRLIAWIHEALLCDRLDIIADFLEETNIAIHRLSIRCVRFENKEEANEEAKTLDYFDWVNFLKRYNIPSDDLSDENGKRLRIGEHLRKNSISTIDEESYFDFFVDITFTSTGKFRHIGFFED